MLRIHKILTLSISGLLLAGMTMTANADSITLPTQSFTGATDFTGSFLFTKFNPSLGTLNSVVITLGTDMNTSLLVTNNSGSESSGTADTKLQAILADPTTTFTTSGNNLQGTGGLFKLRGSVTTDGSSDNSDFYDLNGTGSVTVTPPEAISTAGPTTFSTSPVLTFFTGSSGNAQINYKTLTTTVLSNSGGNTTAAQSTTDDFSVIVTYNYSPAVSSTPEPGTWAMMVAGASTGLVALRRRRRNKK